MSREHPDEVELRQCYVAALERIEALEAAIRKHRNQKSDDRCWMDDQELYKALGDGKAGDNRVGNPTEMLRNCRRFIERRCKGGGWPTYAELEALILRARDALQRCSDWFAKHERGSENLDALLGETLEAIGQALVKATEIQAVPLFYLVVDVTVQIGPEDWRVEPRVLSLTDGMTVGSIRLWLDGVRFGTTAVSGARLAPVE